MTDSQEKLTLAEFAIDSGSPTKRPEQLVNLLVRVLGQEFPDVFESLEVTQAYDSEFVSVIQLQVVGEEVRKKVAHRARVVYGEFVNSPWY